MLGLTPPSRLPEAPRLDPASPGVEKERCRSPRASPPHTTARALTTSPPRVPRRLRGPPTTLAPPPWGPARPRPRSAEAPPSVYSVCAVPPRRAGVSLTAPTRLHPVPASELKISLRSVLVRVELHRPLPFPLQMSMEVVDRCLRAVWTSSGQTVLMTGKNKQKPILPKCCLVNQ